MAANCRPLTKKVRPGSLPPPLEHRFEHYRGVVLFVVRCEDVNAIQSHGHRLPPSSNTRRRQRSKNRWNARIVAARLIRPQESVKGISFGQTAVQFCELPQTWMPPSAV